MSTKQQHFVPQVYMKAWETTVETIAEPSKKFTGVYTFVDGQSIGNGANRDSILWEPRLYTIRFNYSYISKSCPLVQKYFVDQIFDLMQNCEPAPVYAKLNYVIIKTKNSIRDHLYDIDNWDFYYLDGRLARKKGILNRIYELNCYILENAFDSFFENAWENTCYRFIDETKNGTPIAYGKSERRINKCIAVSMLKFVFMMLCRNPKFDAMGIYTRVKDRVLYPAFEGNKQASDEIMTGVWYSELYSMFFKQSGGFFHYTVPYVMGNCQMILFEAYNGEGNFLTSDNPSIKHISAVTRENLNGFIFPITPKYLIFIGRGEPDAIDIVDYRYANKEVIQQFNRIIVSNKISMVISNKREIDSLVLDN